MKRHAFSVAVLCVSLISPVWCQEASPAAAYRDTVRGYYELASKTHGNPLGVEVAATEATLRAQLGVDEGVGVVVTSVANEKDAAKLGLKLHDIVLKFDELPVTSPKKFHELVGSLQGKTIRLHLLRQGKPLEVSVPIPKAPVYALFHEKIKAASAEQRYRIGVSLAEADDTLRTQLKLAAGEGLVVTNVVTDSPAAGAGLKQHDVLIKLDNKRLSTADSVNEQIQQIKDRQVTVVYLRAGQEATCNLTPQLGSESAAAYRAAFTDRTIRSLVRVQDVPLAVRWSNVRSTVSATDKLAELKKQLAQIQKTVESLEAALQPPAKEKP